MISALVTSVDVQHIFSQVGYFLEQRNSINVIVWVGGVKDSSTNP